MLLFAYQRETALDVGAPQPERPEDVWLPVRQETVDPASVLVAYLVAYERGRPVGGVALVPHDGLSVALKRGYVVPSCRRRGVARALVDAAAVMATDRGLSRLVLDVLPSRRGAIAAWHRMGFAEADPWGDPTMVYLERSLLDTSRDAWLGVRHGEVVLRESDPRWKSVFAHQAELLRRTLGDQAIALEHVGSTAVDGLVAKPIVDVGVQIRDDADETTVIATLEAKGYEFRGDQGDAGGLFFVLQDRPPRRIVHVHVVRAHDRQWEDYLRIRDMLRTDPRLRTAYGELKRQLARRFPADRPAYTRAKSEFVEEVARPVTT